ncbi:MAG: HIT domain-containing protein [Candidatus Omnitrophica bacterium]|nr:HIT domain-containing protein [Candidatus Omnitrophota bacterium]
MQKLWAPWREKYVTKDIRHNKGCVFCRIHKEKKDKENFVIVRKEYCFVVLNIYPYNNGHTLILPYRHVNDISKLKKAEKLELYDLIDETRTLLDDVLQPGGYNIGCNLGRIAGAGYPGHLHFHIVPRWSGDVNFMPVVGQTKVISQSLQILYKQLIHAYKNRH